MSVTQKNASSHYTFTAKNTTIVAHPQGQFAMVVFVQLYISNPNPKPEGDGFGFVLVVVEAAGIKSYNKSQKTVTYKYAANKHV